MYVRVIREIKPEARGREAPEGEGFISLITRTNYIITVF